MSKTNVPAIPAITPNNIQDVAAAVKNLLDIREGLIGDPLDANITFRDLVESGIAQKIVGQTSRTSLNVPISPSWVESDGYDPTQDFTPPSKPTNFTVTNMFAAVQLQWDKSPDRNFSYTEIWRSDTNVIGNALLVGTSDTRFYVDTLSTQTSKYYWIRFVSKADVKGPYNATGGTAGAAADDPSYLMNVLSDAYGTTSQAPFFQIDSATTINGVSVPAGTYIKAAYIADATITTAKIKDAAINNAKISDLNASKITAGFLSADRIDAGSITADKIDTRGLSIKNAAGTVIFSSGTNLSVSYITGLGSLATKNGVTTSDVSGLGAFATLDKIKSTNVSTYIESAAIGLALIDTASIATLSSIKADMGTITAGKMKSADDQFVIDLTNKTISISV